MMKVLEITTVIGCAVGCKYCPQSTLVKNYNDKVKKLSINDFILFLDKLDKSINIHFTGYSEAFLNDNCMDMIEYAYNKGHKVKVNTTLVGMKISDAQRLVKIPLVGLMLHLPAEENLENINVNNEYLECLQIILKNPPCKINTVYHGKTLKKEVRPYFNEVYRGKIHYRAGNANVENLAERSEIESDHRYVSKLKGKISCNRIYQNVLLPNGDITICCMDYGLKHIIGNLKTDSVEDLYKSNEFLKVLNGMNNENSDSLCRSCFVAAKNVDLKAKFYNKFIPKIKAFIHNDLTIKRRIKEKVSK